MFGNDSNKKYEFITNLKQNHQATVKLNKKEQESFLPPNSEIMKLMMMEAGSVQGQKAIQLGR